MAVDGGHRDGACDWDGRWNHVKKFLERPGPFTHPDFEPSTEVTKHSWEGKACYSYTESVQCDQVWASHFSVCLMVVSFTPVSTILVGDVQDTGDWSRRTWV